MPIALNLNNQLSFAGYKVINYRILNGSQVPNFSAAMISYAVSQALGIWSAWSPLIFRRMYDLTQGDIAIDFYPDERGGPLGTAAISIDTTEPFFLNKYKEPISLPYGPFDLIAAIAHEIGHRICYVNRHSPVGGLMYYTQGERVVNRNLNQVEIDEIQNKYGRLLIQPIFMNLNRAVLLNYTGNVNFQKSASMLTVQGDENTSLAIQLSIANIIGKKINAIKIKVKCYSKYAIVNKVMLYDGTRVMANQILSFSSEKSKPAEFVIAIGLPKKPLALENLTVKIEFLFLNVINATYGMDRNRIDISEIKIETVPKDWQVAKLLMI